MLFTIRPPPVVSRTDTLCRNRRRHSSCSNLRQRRREDTTNNPNSRKVNRRKSQGFQHS